MKKIEDVYDHQIHHDSYEKRLKDFKWALGLNRFSLRLMGVWPGDDVIHDRRLAVHLRVPSMILIMFICNLLPEIYALILVIKELPLVIDNMLYSCSAAASCIKLFFIWRSKQDLALRQLVITNLNTGDCMTPELLQKVLRPVIQSFARDWLRPKRTWEHEAMRREASRARLFTISGYAVIAGCYSVFAMAPILGFNVRLISNITDYGERHLFTQSYYPYDYSKSPNYELTFVSQLFGGIFVAMAVSVPDNYFAALVFHLSAQFEILGVDLEQCIRENYESARTSRKTEFNKKLGAFIDRHVHLMAIVGDLEQSFSFVIVTQILCMSIMVCSLGFGILGMFDSSGGPRLSPFQVLTLFLTMSTLMMHTLVDCFASETLALRSGGIFYNIYNSKWYTVPQDSTRDVIPMMIISKSSRRLTAGKVLYLSMETYCNIMKTIAGYISMLISVNSS